MLFWTPEIQRGPVLWASVGVWAGLIPSGGSDLTATPGPPPAPPPARTPPPLAGPPPSSASLVAAAGPPGGQPELYNLELASAETRVHVRGASQASLGPPAGAMRTDTRSFPAPTCSSFCFFTQFTRAPPLHRGVAGPRAAEEPGARQGEEAPALGRPAQPSCGPASPREPPTVTPVRSGDPFWQLPRGSRGAICHARA